MLSTDRPGFEVQIKTMMGGFPGYFLTDERIEAYWRGLQKMQMPTLIRVVDHVLSEDGPEKIPSVSALWTIYRSLKHQRADNRTVDVPLSREASLAHLRRTAIECAKRETMPSYKGVISRNSPEHRAEQSRKEWLDWDTECGQKSDDYWMPRAAELMRQWGGTRASEIDFDDVLTARA